MANYYIFRIKKGKFELEVDSDNKYFVLMQYEKLLKEFEIPKKTKKKGKEEIKEEIPVTVPKKIAEPEPTPEPEKIPESEPLPEPLAEVAVDAIIEPEPVVEVVEQPEPEPEVEIQEPEIEVEPEPETEPVAEAQPEEIPDEPEVFPEPESELELEPEVEPEPPEIPEIKKFEPAKEVDEFLYNKKKEQESPAKPKNKFQDIIKQKLHEAGEILAPKKEEPMEVDPEELELAEELQKSFAESDEGQEEAAEKPKDPQKVYDILEEKLAELPEEDKARLNLNKKEEKKSLKPGHFKKLEDLIYLKRPQTKLDYLLLTSYYLQESEDLDKYSLKQINAFVLPHTKDPIDHSVIHEAVAHEYLEVVPDYLGTADITEYKLTSEGQDYILNEL